MKYQVVCVLAALLASPLSASAQEDGSTPNRPQPQSEPAQEAPALQLELDAAGVGAAAMIATGILLGVRKRKLRTLREAAYREGRRRAQWDLARSRLVF